MKASGVLTCAICGRETPWPMRCNCGLICDRCKKPQPGAFVGQKVSGGIYDVTGGTWKAYANPGERLVCDTCMHADPRYCAVYGPFAPTTPETTDGCL